MPLPPKDKRQILQKLHDAAGIGDVETVQNIFDKYRDELDVNVYRKGGNTALHTALYHSQEGMLIDYLIRAGANVNGLNSKGFSPLLVAVMRCKNGNAVKKLVAAGADIDVALQKASREGKKDAVIALSKLKEDDICNETKLPIKVREGLVTCPICNTLVRFPTRMSRIIGFQEEIDKKMMQNNLTTHNFDNGPKNKKKKIVYTSRKYLDELLTHSEGRAYKKLCNIEYHGVENMKIRKEISESFAILHAVQECCTKFTGGVVSNLRNETICLENTFLIDLCSGKGITTALCGALFPQDNDSDGGNNCFLAVDRLLPEQVPHFLNDKHINYLSRDIMKQEMLVELAEIIYHQVHVKGRTAILVGMHLCGMLSEKAIEFFERIPEIKGVVLSPCCLPSKFDLFHSTNFQKDKENDSYKGWCDHLEGMLAKCDVNYLRQYVDEDMHTMKNRIIVCVR